MLQNTRRSLLRPLLGRLCSGASGMTNSLANIAGAAHYDVDRATNIKWHDGGVTTEAKESLMDQRGAVLWFTGNSMSY